MGLITEVLMTYDYGYGRTMIPHFPPPFHPPSIAQEKKSGITK